MLFQNNTVIMFLEQDNSSY